MHEWTQLDLLTTNQVLDDQPPEVTLSKEWVYELQIDWLKYPTLMATDLVVECLLYWWKWQNLIITQPKWVFPQEIL